MDARSKAIKMKIQGLTYAEIGEALGVSRQRAQQLVSPPKEIYNFVKRRAERKCEDCGVRLDSGHVHHVDNTEDYNDVDNLKYMCAACHATAHVGDWDKGESGEKANSPVIRLEFSSADKELIAGLEKKLGVKWRSLVRMGIRVLAAKEGVSA